MILSSNIAVYLTTIMRRTSLLSAALVTTGPHFWRTLMRRDAELLRHNRSCGGRSWGVLASTENGRI
jgi:hypothetical protein